jgi:hypothetical protein
MGLYTTIDIGCSSSETGKLVFYAAGYHVVQIFRNDRRHIVPLVADRQGVGNLPCRVIADPHIPDFPVLYKGVHGLQGFFKGCVVIGLVQIVNVDIVGIQPF